MSAYFDSINLKGMSHWMEMQAGEKFFHAQKFYKYLAERGGRILLKAIAEPPAEWKSAEDVITEVLAHEQKVTALINNLVNIAIEKKDHASNNMLQWFVAKQVEEESTADDILQRINSMCENSTIFIEVGIMFNI